MPRKRKSTADPKLDDFQSYIPCREQGILAMKTHLGAKFTPRILYLGGKCRLTFIDGLLYLEVEDKDKAPLTQLYLCRVDHTTTLDDIKNKIMYGYNSRSRQNVSSSLKSIVRIHAALRIMETKPKTERRKQFLRYYHGNVGYIRKRMNSKVFTRILRCMFSRHLSEIMELEPTDVRKITYLQTRLYLQGFHRQTSMLFAIAKFGNKKFLDDMMKYPTGFAKYILDYTVYRADSEGGYRGPGDGCANEREFLNKIVTKHYYDAIKYAPASLRKLRWNYTTIRSEMLYDMEGQFYKEYMLSLSTIGTALYYFGIPKRKTNLTAITWLLDSLRNSTIQKRLLLLQEYNEIKPARKPVQRKDAIPRDDQIIKDPTKHLKFATPTGKTITVTDSSILDPTVRHIVKWTLNACSMLVNDPTIDIWHEFKKIMRYDKSKRPSFMGLRRLMSYIRDGNRLYERFYNNDEHIHFKKVYKGSIVKALKAAAYNHNQENRLSAEIKVSGPNRPMGVCVVIEKYMTPKLKELRIKDTHGLALAGHECHHCIGSYADSGQIFFRETKRDKKGNIISDVCAQVEPTEMRVYQCYDYRNTTTKASQRLQSYINGAFSRMRSKMSKKERSEIHRVYSRPNEAGNADDYLEAF